YIEPEGALVPRVPEGLDWPAPTIDNAFTDADPDAHTVLQPQSDMTDPRSKELQQVDEGTGLLMSGTQAFHVPAVPLVSGRQDSAVVEVPGDLGAPGQGVSGFGPDQRQKLQAALDSWTGQPATGQSPAPHTDRNDRVEGEAGAIAPARDVRSAISPARLSFEDDLVMWVNTRLGKHGLAEREQVLETWERLKNERGEAALPRNIRGRADVVAQAIRLGEERSGQAFRMVGGAGGYEGETKIVVVFPPQVQAVEGSTIVTWANESHKHVKVKLDRTAYFVGESDNRWHASLKVARQRGNVAPDRRTVFIAEIVVPPFAIGPGDEGLPSREQALAEFQDVLQRLRRASRLRYRPVRNEEVEAGLHGTGLPISQAFPRSEGFIVPFWASDARFLQPLDDAKGMGVFFQYTYDVPLDRMPAVLDWALREDNAHRIASRLVDDGLEFGEYWQGRYKEYHNIPGRRRNSRNREKIEADSRLLMAHVALVYTHVAARALSDILVRYYLIKNLLVVASRSPLHMIRETLLPPEVRAFLDRNGENIIAEFVRKFRAELPGIDKISRIRPDGDIDIDRPLDATASGLEILTIRQSLESSLLDEPTRLVSQDDLVGMADGYALGPSGDKVTVEFRFDSDETFTDIGRLNERLDELHALVWPDSLQGGGAAFQSGRGGARGDDPVALRWPVGHPIVVEVIERGSP
ncbi:hypothetical protein, partial [Actinoallomurus sp. NPDC050550]|uniref:hypothetical protein n=1 Tax=Actinoallomurus sp. NPDC050550 TaxID=3154937 RepID=UPI00340B6B61